MKKVFILLAAALIFAGMISCRQSSKTTCNVMCTDLYVSVGVRVVDANGNPITLDDHYTIRNSTGEIIRSQDKGYEGVYSVLEDAYLNKLKNAYASFTFVGVKNGVKVIESPYVIAADCCHVRKLSGDNTIVVK